MTSLPMTSLPYQRKSSNKMNTKVQMAAITANKIASFLYRWLFVPVVIIAITAKMTLDGQMIEIQTSHNHWKRNHTTSFGGTGFNSYSPKIYFYSSK